MTMNSALSRLARVSMSLSRRRSREQRTGERTEGRTILAVSAISIVVVAIVIQLVTGDATGTVASVGIVVGNLSAGLLFVRFSQSLEPNERRAWRFVGIGVATSAAGVAGVGILVLATGTAPAFGPFDVFFVAAYGLMLTGLGLLPQLINGANRTRVYLDGAVGAVSLGALLWFWLYEDLAIALSDAPFSEVMIALLYPALDVATMVMVTIVIVRRSAFRFDPRLVIFVVALTFQAVADLSYAITSTGKSFGESAPNYIAFLLATLGYVVAGSMVGTTPPRREYAEQRPPWWSLIAPYGSAFLVVGALSVRIFNGSISATDRGLYLAALTVGGLVIFRQLVSIDENRKLVEDERAALVSSISHELRTPLTSVVGYLGLLETPDGPLDTAERNEAIGLASEQARYIADMVTDLVMLSRDDPALLNIDRTAVTVRQLISQTVLMVGTEDQVRIDVPESLIAHVDEKRMRQVLTNLLTNAQRYGGPLHLVVARNENMDLIVEVHDNGSGVPIKYQLSIWDRFERGLNRLNAKVPGSGIGLAVVSLIVRAHGGVATYERSRLLGGACFRIRIPGCVAWESLARSWTAIGEGGNTPT